MRDLHRMRIMTLAALALGACTTMPLNQASEEQAIRGVTNDFVTAFNARDASRVSAFYTPDAVVMMSNSPLASGTSGIHGALAEFFKTPGVSLSVTPSKIDVVSPTVATDVGTYALTFDTPQGKVTDSGNYTAIWHKVAGQWRMAVDAPVTTMPMPMPGAPAAVAYAPNMNIVANSSLSWSDFTPPGFNPGMKLALVQGDPGKPGAYVLRLPFPAGYKFPVHWHPGAENLTVVSGTFQLGMGNTADWNSLKNYGPGDYLYIPPRHAHFGGSAASGPSVIQLHGQGPFEVMLGPPQ